jgi:hypothetical protein
MGRNFNRAIWLAAPFNRTGWQAASGQRKKKQRKYPPTTTLVWFYRLANDDKLMLSRSYSSDPALDSLGRWVTGQEGGFIHESIELTPAGTDFAVSRQA